MNKIRESIKKWYRHSQDISGYWPDTKKSILHEVIVAMADKIELLEQENKKFRMLAEHIDEDLWEEINERVDGV